MERLPFYSSRVANAEYETKEKTQIALRGRKTGQTMKTPLRVVIKTTATWIEDADGQMIAMGGSPLSSEADMRELVRRANAYDKLWEAAHDAYILAEDRTDTAPEPCEDTDLLSLMVSTQDALDTAKAGR